MFQKLCILFGAYNILLQQKTEKNKKKDWNEI